MAYEEFRNQFAAAVEREFPDSSIDVINRLMCILDHVAGGYTVERQTTDIIIANGELPDWAKEYLVAKKIQGLSLSTLKDRKMYLEIFFRAVQKPIPTITTNDIRIFLIGYQQKRGITDQSLDSYRAVLKAFFSWLVDNEYINRDPTKNIMPIKYAKKQREALTQYGLEIVRSKIKNKREKAIIEFLYSTGCRVAELCGVKMSDVDWNAGTVKLFGKGKKERIGYLNAKSIVALREYLSSCNFISQYLFGSMRAPHGKVTTGAIQKTVRNIRMRCGLEVTKSITPHVMRHTMATQALKSGMPLEQISMLLGHSNLDTTRIYAEVAAVDVQLNHAKYIV